MKIVAGTAGMPAEPCELYWGTILIIDEFTKESYKYASYKYAAFFKAKESPLPPAHT